MSSAVVASLPFQAGGAVALATGRALFWAYSQFMRQPLRNAGLASMVGLSALAGSNALYFQSHRHPAPLFGVADPQMEVADAAPAMPPVRPKTLKLSAPDTTTTGSVKAPAATPAAAPIGNAEVFELQRKLQGLGLFDAAVDGLFGPRTARAIRAFEERQGLKSTGQLTQEIVDLILSTSIVAPAPKIEPLPTPDPLPTAKAKDETPELIVNSLPSPQPLADLTDEASSEAAVGDAIDSILDGVQTMAMTKPNAVSKRVVQTIAVKAITQAAQAVAELPAETPVEMALAPTTQQAAIDPTIIEKVQRGLASLGFLHGAVDGVAGEATAKAIRNFEVYYRYDVTGRITPELVDLLVQNGAMI